MCDVQLVSVLQINYYNVALKDWFMLLCLLCSVGQPHRCTYNIMSSFVSTDGLLPWWVSTTCWNAGNYLYFIDIKLGNKRMANVTFSRRIPNVNLYRKKNVMVSQLSRNELHFNFIKSWKK